MDYIRFNNQYVFLKQQIAVLEKIMQKEKINHWHLMAELGLLEKSWKERAALLQADFRQKADVFALLHREDAQRQFVYFLSLLKWFPELCDGQYASLSSLLRQVENDPGREEFRLLKKMVPEMVEVLTTRQAALWLLKEAEKSGTSAFVWAEWLVTHDFQQEAATAFVRRMISESVPWALLMIGSKEGCVKMADLFYSYKK